MVGNQTPNREKSWELNQIYLLSSAEHTNQIKSNKLVKGCNVGLG